MELVVRYMPLPIYTGNHVGYLRTGCDFLKKYVENFPVAYCSTDYPWLLNQVFLPCILEMVLKNSELIHSTLPPPHSNLLHKEGLIFKSLCRIFLLIKPFNDLIFHPPKFYNEIRFFYDD